MLNLVNTTTIEDIELDIEVVQVKALVNQSVGSHVDLLVRDNYNVPELNMVVGLVAVQYRILKFLELMKITLMKKVMMNMMKMLMMTVMEMRMLKLIDMHHPSKL